MSFSEIEFASKKKTTRREKFLAQMEAVVPWGEWVALIEPYYYPGERGRRPIGIECMLRLYMLQIWYDLADEALEDTVYDSQAMRRFVGVDLSRESVPDATTLLKFRHLLAAHQLTEKMFYQLRTRLEQAGLLMKEGTIVDATILAAPTSTKNQDKVRDPEMHQVKKGNEWYFGMKAHIGVDATSGLVHTIEATAANVADIAMTASLLHGDEKRVHADAGYTGVEKREEIQDGYPYVEWHVATKRGKIKKMPEGPEKEAVRLVEKAKASIRSKVEHPFHIVKNLFRHRKIRYRGIAKNLVQLFALFASVNLVMISRRLITAPA